MDAPIPDALKYQAIEHLRGFVSPERNRLMESVLAERTRHLCVVLEDIYQPHNASAVLRTCDCLGIQDVHVIEHSNRFRHKKSVSLGAEKWLTTLRYREPDSVQALVTCADHLKQQGYHLVATTLRPGAIPIDALPDLDKVAVMFGNEEWGLSREAHERADTEVYLPMTGFTQSLNISVTAALTLQRLRDRLRAGPSDWRLSANEQRDLQLQWLTQDVRGGDKIIQRFLAEQGKTSA